MENLQLLLDSMLTRLGILEYAVMALYVLYAATYLISGYRSKQKTKRIKAEFAEALQDALLNRKGGEQ